MPLTLKKSKRIAIIAKNKAFCSQGKYFLAVGISSFVKKVRNAPANMPENAITAAAEYVKKVISPFLVFF